MTLAGTGCLMRPALLIQLVAAALAITAGIVLAHFLGTWLGLAAFLAVLALGYALTAPTRSD